MTEQVNTYTEKQAESGDRKNEDLLFVKENDQILVAVVVDGGSALSTVTTIHDTEGLGGLFVSKAVVESADAFWEQAESATELLVNANQSVRNKLLDLGVDPEIASPLVLPTAGGVSIVRIDKKLGVIQVAQTGDSAVIVVKSDGAVELALPVDSAPFDLKAITLAREVAKDKNISLREALKDERVAELFICSRANENNSDGTGSGAVNGRESMNEYLKSVNFPLNVVVKIIMLSDGLFPPQEDFSQEPNWKMIAGIVDKDGLEGLSSYVREIKASDPTLDKFPRAKQYDDTTGILIKTNWL